MSPDWPNFVATFFAATTYATAATFTRAVETGGVLVRKPCDTNGLEKLDSFLRFRVFETQLLRPAATANKPA